jgi:hypothetical protein
MQNPYQSCIDACMLCAEACDHCAASCLRETDITMMVRCVQLDLECSAVCRAASQLMELGSNHANAISQLCADICLACAEECEKHDHDHCRECAIMCRKCAEECMSMAAA